MGALRRLFTLSILWGVLATAPVAALAAGLAEDPPIENGELALYEIYNAVGDASLGSNAELQAGFYTEDDQTWDGLGDQVLVLVARNAVFSNDVGIYTDLGVGDDMQMIFDDVTGQGMLAMFDAEMLPDDDLGFYLDTGADMWHSEMALDSGTSFDHMATYRFGSNVLLSTDMGELLLANAAMIAWEDLPDIAPPDADYQDFVMVRGTLVPEPGTALQVALGLGILGRMRRRRRS